MPNENELAMPEVTAAAGQRRRELFMMLSPLIVILLQTLGAVFYFGSLNQRVVVLEGAKQQTDSRGGVVTREDMKDHDALSAVQQQEMNNRLRDLDQKIDQVLENQSDHKGR